MALLDEYIVGPTTPWGPDEAAHLYRRAGFGGTVAERAAAVGGGDQNALRAAVDALVDYLPQDPWLDVSHGATEPTFGDSIPDLPDTADVTDPVGTILSQIKHPADGVQIAGQWIYRMRHTSQPLQEQLALFLHDHMVSEIDKIQMRIPPFVSLGNDGTQPLQVCNTGTLPFDLTRPARMAAESIGNQVTLFRAAGADSFRELLINITRDPAMLVYLDNMLNNKDAPQENYAREVMELFSMGVGNYTENDIRQIAKCLTGETLIHWAQGVLVACANDFAPDYGFYAPIHTPGPKTVFGQTINESFTGQETIDVIDLILNKVSVVPNALSLQPPYNDLPATAVYMSWKLLTWFVDHDIQLQPAPDPAVLELAHYMRGADNAPYPQRRFPYDIRACLRKVFLSEFFFDLNHRQSMHKTPADFIASVIKGLEIDELYTLNRGPTIFMTLMGQRLYNPPNVAGWNHGRNWTSTGNVIIRSLYGFRIAYELLNGFTEYGKAVLDSWLVANGGTINGHDDDEGLVELLDQRLLHGTMPQAERDTLLAALAEMLELAPAPNLAEPRYYLKAGAMIYMIIALPRFQLK